MRLLLVHAGGTLMMRSGAGTPLAPDYTRDLLTEVPVLRRIADIESRVILQLDSADMQPEDWVTIARTVHEALDDYDGIVIVHGTDTMAYTASALAFLLPGLDRPVILTGSQRPIDRIRSDARANLINAFQLATWPIPEVGVAFASELYRGCRSTKVDAWGLEAFASPNCRPLAKLGVGIEIASHILRRRTPQPFDPSLEPRVLAMTLFPGVDPALLESALDSGVRGLVLQGFGAGNVPTKARSLIRVIEKATSMDVPVVITSQCVRAHVDLSTYEGGAAALAAGAIGAGDMTDEAALTKLMITLGRAERAVAESGADGVGNYVKAAAEAFEKSTVGEMSEPG